ncbi:MAG: acyltransferase [Cetobacterium sp.]
MKKKILKLIYKLFIKLKNIKIIFINNFIYKNLFKKFGAKSRIIKPLKLSGFDYIEILENIIINENAWIMALKVSEINPNLNISSGVRIGHYAHIICVNSIIIEKNVLIADKVYISDNYHEYKDITKPIVNQGVKIKSKVVIGEGSWIGENVSIIGSKIGKNCIIGANTVVVKDIPDYCIVGGVPGKILKKYNIKTKKWERFYE